MKELNIKNKLDIIAKVENGSKIKDICGNYKISKQTAHNIIKKKDAMKNCINNNINNKMKRIVKGNNDQIKEATLHFIKQCNEIGIPITGTVIQEKAIKFAQLLNINNFKASNGWLEKFKKKYNIKCKKISGEGKDINKNVVLHFREKIESLCKHYEPHNIFNADETGLFYKCLPNQTNILVGEKCIGGKRSKERLTIMLGANMNGSEKLIPLIIGKYKYKNNKTIKSLPIIYKSQNKAWMTREIFEEWLNDLNEHFKYLGRKILLFVDNCSCHMNINEEILTNIQVFYLPPNTTTHTQPMDLGIIKNFKYFYRKLIVYKFINQMEQNSILKISLEDAIYYITQSWERVKNETIANCYNKAGFINNENKLDSITHINLDHSYANLENIIFFNTDTFYTNEEYIPSDKLFAFNDYNTIY